MCPSFPVQRGMVMLFDLPTETEIGGTKYAIRSDYRDILTIILAFNDPDLNDEEKAIVALDIFYPDFDSMPPEHIAEAMNYITLFVNGGHPNPKQKSPKLVDWEKDFEYIIAPVNRVIGREIRADKYLHWYTFLSAYYEIGDCLFAQIVRIRDRIARGKKLDDTDREWLRRNSELVQIENKLSEAEQATLDLWTKPQKVVE